MRNKLIETIKESHSEWLMKTYDRETDKNVCEYLADDLLENGLVVLPCKVGDKVFQLDNGGNIYESEITKLIYDTAGIAFDESAIGKSIFLTRQEAERTAEEKSIK